MPQSEAGFGASSPLHRTESSTMESPNFLYKYQTLTAYSLASLINKTVWLSKPSAFNDPFDCAITLDRRKLKESILHATSSATEGADRDSMTPNPQTHIEPKHEEAFEHLRSKIKDIFQNIGICSFSATCNHLLMWSHYANHHRGFCVEYDFTEGTELRKIARKVKYGDSIPSLSAFDLTSPGPNSNLDELWLTKAKCWEYEEEWRIMINKGDNTHLAPSRISSVIFGARMPEQDRVMIRNAIKHHHEIKFKEAKLKDDSFLIEILPMNR